MLVTAFAVKCLQHGKSVENVMRAHSFFGHPALADYLALDSESPPKPTFSRDDFFPQRKFRNEQLLFHREFLSIQKTYSRSLSKAVI